MSGINLSLAVLFENAFGYKSEAFTPEFKGVVGNKSGNGFIREEFGSFGTEYYKYDVNGREYFLPVLISFLKAGKMTEIDMPYPVISIKSRKTLVETQLTERRSPVVEFINLAGWDISIRGLCIARTNEFPEDIVNALIDVYSANAPVIIRNACTDLALNPTGYRAVIKDFNLPEVKGVKNVRQYEMNLTSDEDFNLIDIV